MRSDRRCQPQGKQTRSVKSDCVAGARRRSADPFAACLCTLVTLFFAACVVTFAERPAFAKSSPWQSGPAVSAPAVSLPARPAANEQTVHHIRTSTQYEDGTKEVRHGTGFVVGRQFFTVFHNIDVLNNHGSWERRIELGGIVVEPRLVDSRTDIAIFDLPSRLCELWCNDRDPRALPLALSQQQSIGWFEFVSVNQDRQWRQARIVEVVFKNYTASTADAACQSDVVIAVDQPFYPGSSGGPVWDLTSNRLLGMVQGSFVRESGEQVGYYKPFSCVQSLLSGSLGPASVELALSSSY